MRKIIRVAIAAAVGLIAVELVASYVYYWHYPVEYRGFRPSGSKAIALLRRSSEKLRGIHHEVRMSIDHGPLFAASDLLGFTMLPGRYHVTELYEARKHVFDLTVTAGGWRATSYAAPTGGKRLFITGDSALFGWGVDDEATVPWLMQSRLPDYDVVNLSLNSYSTVHALLQLQQVTPQVGPDDIVVLEYHPASNAFNVAAPDFLKSFLDGYELQLGDAERLRAMEVPFGTLDAHGAFTVGRIQLSCATTPNKPGCMHPNVGTAVAQRMTELAFDAIIAMNIRHLLVAILSGPDDDPVILHLRSRGVAIADLRTVDGMPDDADIIPTDLHSGPFWHHQAYALLLKAMQRLRMVN